MISDNILRLIQAQETVSSLVAQNPSETPSDGELRQQIIWRQVLTVEVCKKLYGHAKATTTQHASGVDRPSSTPEDIDLLLKTFDFGPQRPSDLFLKVFHDAVQCLDYDPLGGMVSPPLMGSHGSIPLTAIAPLADIFRHMANLIVRAQKEVILITCSWSPSLATKLISEALKELSRRAAARNERVVVKIMYDKAGAANFMNPRQHVKPEVFSGEKIQLPHPTDVPNLDLEVCNLHVPLLGTLHAKFMVVDRKVAVIESNNTEENDNMEMMTHFEGPIVDSIYDTALITWGLPLHPPLPSANTPARSGGLHVERQQEPLHTDRGNAREQDTIVQEGQAAQLPEHTPDDPHYDDDLSGEITRMQSAYSPKPNESRLEATNRQLNLACKNKAKISGPEIPDAEAFTPYIPASSQAGFPIAVVSRLPYGTPKNDNVFVPQNEAWLSSIRNAQREIFIQTPDLNAYPLTEVMVSALKRGVSITYYVCLGYNDAGELMPGQGGTNEMFATKLVERLSEEELNLLSICYYVGKDQDHPIHNSFKQRSCHVKLLIADGHLGIQGSGNQDTQSWYHSQEINVMIDSEEVCRKWREGIERNQNTARFGKADMKDGIWRDAHGNKAVGSTEEPSNKVSGWVTGAKGMLKKMQDKGGF